MNTTYKVPFVLTNEIQGRMTTLHFRVGVCGVWSNAGQLSPAHHACAAQPAGRVTTSLLEVGDPWMFRDMRSCLSLLDLNHLALFYNMLNEILLSLFIFKETERASRRVAERERIPSRLRPISAEPDVGLGA